MWKPGHYDFCRHLYTGRHHRVSDFTELPRQYGLTPVLVNEYFDEDDRSGIPRILTVVLQKRI
ncbi:MAG TPA: hypothetical protein VGN00_13895 [Puia sp.]